MHACSRFTRKVIANTKLDLSQQLPQRKLYPSRTRAQMAFRKRINTIRDFCVASGRFLKSQEKILRSPAFFQPKTDTCSCQR